ncbi:uncharacterized protein DS421_19g653300 [Arachis hypogaea]|uniref:Uncharacterized protein n=1 Tax=Arachis hypogaea TaxID=3818 RepID=A0A6B9V8C1_ARAHY|nr:uncharacterized protein DS421_19g653300 [Arachis hypogaea]
MGIRKEEGKEGRCRRAAVASSSCHLAAAMAHRVKREESVPPRHCPTRRVSRPLPSRRREHRGERLRDCERGRSAEERFCSCGRASLPQIAVQPLHHRATVIATLGERNVAATGSQEGKSSHEEGESCGEREAVRSVARVIAQGLPLCYGADRTAPRCWGSYRHRKRIQAAAGVVVGGGSCAPVF